MKCPKCVQKIHRRACQCPHCGFVLSDLDDLYGAEDVRVRKLNDVAGVLKLKDRRKAKLWFEHFEKRFPQLFFSVHFGVLDERANIRQFGMWLLNKAAYEDVDITRPNDGGILLVVDVHSKTASISFGYRLDVFLTEKDTFHILSKAHPYMLDGNYIKALKVVMKSLSKVLRKKVSHAKRHKEYYQRKFNESRKGVVSELEPLRDQHTYKAELKGHLLDEHRKELSK